MPYAPPRGDKGHSTQFQLGGEDSRVEDEREAQPRVLDTRLDGDGPTVYFVYLE